MITYKRYTALLLCTVVLLTQGCISPEPVENELKSFSVPEAWSRSGKEDIPVQWWRSFNDPELDRLIEIALSGNYSLYEAWDRVDQAAALARANGAGLLPGISAEASSLRSVPITKASTGSSSLSYRTGLTIGMSIRYEVDLWGKIRSAAKASALDALATREDLYAAALSISSQVASTWYRLKAQQLQMDLLKKQYETNQQYLQLIEGRFKHGMVSASDVLQLRQQVESLRAEQISVESVLQLLRHQLAVLCGKAPGTLEINTAGELPEIPPMPDTGIPSVLIKKRPDIRSAFLRMQGADKRAAAAVASRFPSLSFNAGLETSDDKISGLFDNWFANFIGNLTAPIFKGGRLSAEADRTKAAAYQTLNSYRGAVLNALREVEDALVREYHQNAYLRSVEKQTALSSEVVERTMKNYSKGAEDYLRVLTAVQSHERLERYVVQAELTTLLYRIDLYKALGGTWNVKHYRDKKTTK